MSNQIIISKKFEDHKNKIEEYANQLPNNLKIKPVSETTFWGFDKKVTGETLNSIVSHFQNNSIEINKVLSKSLDMFKLISGTFEYLDKDYIQRILIAIKSSEKSSFKAENASIQAVKASNQATVNFKNIKALFENIQDKFKSIESNFELVTKDINTITSAAEVVKSAKYLNNLEATYLQMLDNKSKIVEVNNNLNNILSDLQTEIQEVLKISEENSTNLYKVYANKTDRSIDEITDKQNQLELDVVEKLKSSEENSTNLYKVYVNKTDRSLNDIIVKLNDLKADVEEKIKLSNIILIKLHKEFTDKTDKSLVNITLQQTEIKADILERLKNSNENYIKTNKEYLFKLKIVTITAVLSLLLSITMIVLNLINNG
jgi:flagellar biosynthesis chaperone FliJ